MTLYQFLKRLRMLVELDHEHLRLWRTFVRQPGPYTSFVVYLDDEDNSIFRVTIEKL